MWISLMDFVQKHQIPYSVAYEARFDVDHTWRRDGKKGELYNEDQLKKNSVEMIKCRMERAQERIDQYEQMIKRLEE